MRYRAHVRKYKPLLHCAESLKRLKNHKTFLRQHIVLSVLSSYELFKTNSIMSTETSLEQNI